MTTLTAHKPSKTADIGLKESARTSVLGILDRTLADECVLSAKTRNFHWNVTGFHFSAMHKFFEEQYDALDGIVDETAERSRSIGGRALGSMKDFLLKTRLAEAESRPHSGAKMNCIAEKLDMSKAISQPRSFTPNASA